jgi:recombination protein RecA
MLYGQAMPPVLTTEPTMAATATATAAATAAAAAAAAATAAATAPATPAPATQATRLRLARDALVAGRLRGGGQGALPSGGPPGAAAPTPSNVIPLLRLRNAPRFAYAELVGRLAQLSGPAALTMAMGLVLDAQRAGEPVAWVAAGEAMFFPPDVVESGVDLAGLLVVRAPDASAAARAGDRLLRSSGFGLLIVDLAADLGLGRQIGRGVEVVPMALQARLAKLAQRHDAAVLVVTGEPSPSPSAPSLSSLVSLRAVATRAREGVGRFRCAVQVGKDKRRGPGWRVEEVCRGPAGLR